MKLRAALLLSLLLAATPVLAQEPGEPGAAPVEAGSEAPASPDAGAAAPAPGASAEPPTPRRIPSAPPTPPPLAPEGTSPALLEATARFFGALRAGDASSAASLCASPFRLEAEEIRSGAELRRRLALTLAGAPLAHVPLHGIELLPAAVMLERHGPPPARLGGLDLTQAHVAVANFGGKAVVAVFRVDARGAVRAVALTE